MDVNTTFSLNVLVVIIRTIASHIVLSICTFCTFWRISLPEQRDTITITFQSIVGYVGADYLGRRYRSHVVVVFTSGDSIVS